MTYGGALQVVQHEVFRPAEFLRHVEQRDAVFLRADADAHEMPDVAIFVDHIRVLKNEKIEKGAFWRRFLRFEAATTFHPG